MNGELAGTKFSIEDRMNCFVGRDSECTIHIPRDIDNMVSRNHCMFDINPPDIAIQDFNSYVHIYI